MIGFGIKGLSIMRRAFKQFLRSAQGPPTPSMKKQTRHTGELPPTLPRRLRSQSKLTRGRWVIPEAAEVGFDAPVDCLDLTTKSANILAHLHIKSVRQLLNYPKENLIRMRGFGPKSRADVETNILEHVSGRRQAELGLLRGIQEGVAALPFSTKTFVHRLLSFMPEREQTIVAYRYGLWDGERKTLQEIGDELGVTRERVQQVEAKSLDRLRRRFGPPVVKAFFRRKTKSAVARKSKNKCGAPSQERLVAAMADDCTLGEAALAVAFLQDVASGEAMSLEDT